MDKKFSDLEAELRKNFKAFLRSQGSPITPLWDALNLLRSKDWTAFSFGGVPRGILEVKTKYRPRDLDLVFDDKAFSEFEEAFASTIQRRNSYGGLKLKFNGLDIDAWPLSATWAFRHGLVKDVSFRTLPHTTFLNIDGIVIEANPKKGKARRIYEAGFFDGWINNILDINLIENPHPEICFARTLHISKRFGFKISHRLAKYLWEIFESSSIIELQEAEKKHYGGQQFSGSELLEIFKKLEKELDHTLFPVQLFPPKANQLELAFSRQAHL